MIRRKRMELLLRRIARKSSYTIGRLFIDGEYFCDAIEDKDRGLNSKMSPEYIKKLKVPGQTAIPTGRYHINMNTVSPKFSKKKQYDFIQGKLPRLENVPGYSGVLIHIGNTQLDTDGCLCVGENKIVGMVVNSTATFQKLMLRLRATEEDIWITIV